MSNAYEANPLRAQLFNNVNGQLVIAQTLPATPYDLATFPFVFDGRASPDFTKFSVVDTTLLDTVRIRILDPNFNVVASREITDIILDAPYGYALGGSFSEDSHYVLLYYAGANPPYTGPYYSVVLILDATDPALPTVASTTIAGTQGTYPSPRLFTLTNSNGNENLYFPFTSSQLDEPPYFSLIYGVDPTTGTITLIDEQPLPQLTDGPDVLVRANGKEAVISYGGFCSLFPSQSPVIYDVITPPITSVLPNDNAEARVFIFDGQTQRLLIKQAVNCCNETVAYPPGDGCSYFLGQNVDNYFTPGDTGTQGPNPQDFWCLANIEDGPSGLVFRPQNLPRQDMKLPLMVFSQDGNWLLRTGVYGYIDDVTPLPDSIGIHNILLFNITSTPYQPIC